MVFLLSGCQVREQVVVPPAPTQQPKRIIPESLVIPTSVLPAKPTPFAQTPEIQDEFVFDPFKDLNTIPTEVFRFSCQERGVNETIILRLDARSEETAHISPAEYNPLREGDQLVLSICGEYKAIGVVRLQERGKVKVEIFKRFYPLTQSIRSDA